MSDRQSRIIGFLIFMAVGISAVGVGLWATTLVV